MRKRQHNDAQADGGSPKGALRQLTILPLNMHSLRVLAILEEIDLAELKRERESARPAPSATAGGTLQKPARRRRKSA